MGSSAAAARALRLSARCCRTPAAPHRVYDVRRNLNVPAAAGEAAKLKSLADLPGPSGATTLYWLFLRGYADKSHLLQDVQRKLYGPIWRSQFGPFDIVNVASPELVAQVIRQEGRYPSRAELPHWREYRDLRGQAYGLHVDSGPEWLRLRRALNPRMLKLREVLAFAPVLQQVVGDLLRRVELLRSRSRDGTTVPDVAAELYKFGFEGISSILFESRLGCLRDAIPPDTLRFIAAVDRMLTLSETVVLLPRWSRGVLPFWRRFVAAWDDLYDVARTLIDRRTAEILAQVSGGEPAEGMYLTYLLASDRLSRAEVYITVTELLLGGVDTEAPQPVGRHSRERLSLVGVGTFLTLFHVINEEINPQTSNTLSWALYHLARDGRAQERLHREVSAVCPGRREPTPEELSSMPYLKAVVKETLRLYPVVPGNGRFITDDEVVVGGYWFPKRTQFHLCHYATCHDEQQFADAELFVPERWLRGGAGAYRHHPYSFIPFGVGVRGCVGKRVAEMEMFFALSRLMQHYEVQPEAGAPVVEPKTRTLLVPSRPINLRFLPRA